MSILNNKVVYASGDLEAHWAIIHLCERKTGLKMCTPHNPAFGWITEGRSSLSGESELTGTSGSTSRTVITLKELDSFPDYVEPDYVEMTVAEISRALGRTIKVVE